MQMTIQQVIDTIITDIASTPFPETVDTIKLGDASQPVTGIVLTFLATCEVIEKAIQHKANFIITHEPTFYNHLDQTDWLGDDAVYRAKRRLIEENNLVIWRFHDYFHTLQPDFTIVGLLRDLGWEAYFRPDDLFFFEIPSMTLQQVVDHLKANLRLDYVRVVGKPKMYCQHIGFLPGAIGHEAQIGAFSRPDLDVLICGEINEWETNEYARDAVHQGRNKALIVLGHAASEESGMKWIIPWLQTRLPDIPITFIPTAKLLKVW